MVLMRTNGSGFLDRIGVGCGSYEAPGGVISGGHLNANDIWLGLCLPAIVAASFSFIPGTTNDFVATMSAFFLYLVDFQTAIGVVATPFWSKHYDQHWTKRGRSVGIGEFLPRTGKSYLSNATFSHNFPTTMLLNMWRTQSKFSASIYPLLRGLSFSKGIKKVSTFLFVEGFQNTLTLNLPTDSNHCKMIPEF